MSAREQAWSVSGHILVTSPVDDAAHGCRARVFRVEEFRLERVVLVGGFAFENEGETHKEAALKLVHRLEAYLGGRGQLVSMNLQPLVRAGTWTLES